MSNTADIPTLDADTSELETLADHLKGWFTASGDKTRTVAALAVAETKLAAISVALMAFFATLTAGCVLGAWGLAIAGAIYALLGAGVSLAVALMAAALVHIGAAVVCWSMMKRLSRHLSFRYTRAQFQQDGQVE